MTDSRRTRWAVLVVIAGIATILSSQMLGRAIRHALEENRDEISGSQGEEVYKGWVDVGQIYLSAFREGKLGYQLFTARRP